MGTALLVEYYNELPDAQGDKPKSAGRFQAALAKFRQRVAARYTEGTLQRLLDSSDARARRAAVLALGQTGSMKSNAALAAMLHDDDRAVRQVAADALWSLWLRADTDNNNQELQRLMRLRDPERMQAGLDALIDKTPGFAEAYNQRAILYFRRGELHQSIADCERVLKLNPFHFGAQAGMAQCYMKLEKLRPALKAFRNTHRIHPSMDGVEETIRALESVLGEEGRKDDKK